MIDNRERVVNPNATLGLNLHTEWSLPGTVDVPVCRGKNNSEIKLYIHKGNVLSH